MSVSLMYSTLEDWNVWTRRWHANIDIKGFPYLIPTKLSMWALLVMQDSLDNVRQLALINWNNVMRCQTHTQEDSHKLKCITDLTFESLGSVRYLTKTLLQKNLFHKCFLFIEETWKKYIYHVFIKTLSSKTLFKNDTNKRLLSTKSAY